MDIILDNKQEQLPNATAVLVLGILSVVFSCGLGLILAIIGLFISRQGKLLNQTNPGQYTGFSSLNAGRIMCIIGICLNSLCIIYFIFWIFVISTIVGSLGGWANIFQ